MTHFSVGNITHMYQHNVVGLFALSLKDAPYHE